MNLELGPILRALRHSKGAASLLVLEVALGLSVAVYASALGEWTRGDDLRRVGFDETRAAFVRVFHAAPPRSAAEADAFRRADRAALRETLGVEAVAAVRMDPVIANLPDVVEVPGATPRAFAWRVEGDENIFDALGLSVIAGRSPTRADVDAPGETPVVLSQDLASKLFSKASAIGAHVHSRVLGRDAVVVGVVRAHTVLADDEPHSILYYPALFPLVAEARYVVRFAPGALAVIVPQLKESLGRSGAGEVASIEPLRPPNPESVNGPVADALARSVALVAWCIMLLGVFATSSSLVAARREEIRVRRALGARKTDIVRRFLTENALLTTGGLAMGAGMTFGLAALVHRLAPHTSIVVGARAVAAGAALFAVGSLAAASVPALRAAKVRTTASQRAKP